MLRPIPFQILKTTAELKVPVKTDRNSQTEYATYSLSKTHLQPSSSIKKTKENKEVVLRSLLFFDAVNSHPKGLDFDSLKGQADELGADIEVIVKTITYTLTTVEFVPDDRGQLHHWELGLC